MRLGFVTTSYPTTERATPGAFVEALALALVRAGASIEVVAPMPASGALAARAGITPVPVRYAWPRSLGRTFFGAGVPENATRPLALAGLVTFPPQLVGSIASRARAWDGVVSHWTLPSALAVSLAAPELPHVAFAHSADVHLLERLPGHRRVAARIARTTRAVAAPSRDVVVRLGRLGLDAARVPIGTDERPIDDEERRAARAALGIDGAVVLSLARHVPVKGLDVLVAAATGRAMTCVLAGDGPERARLAGLAAARGARVIFPGEVTGELRRRWLAAADLVCVPSRILPSGRTEGLPTVILEALAAGIPVLATEVGGAPDAVVDGENGLLVRPDDVGALATALRRLEDPRLRARLREGAARSTVPTPDDAARFVLARLRD